MTRILASMLLLLASWPLPASEGPSVEEALRAALASGAPEDIPAWDWGDWRPSLERFYARRSFAPVWFADGRLTRSGAQLLTQLTTVERRGLIAADYQGVRLARAIQSLDGGTSTERIVRLDIALSVTALRLARDLHRGRIAPSQVGYDLDIPKPPFEAAAALSALAHADDVGTVLDAFEPRLRHYKLLKTSLAKYLELSKHPELTRLPPLRGVIHAGESYVAAPELRGLLSALGDLTSTAMAEPAQTFILDAELVAALRRFQSRHGLEADGVLGPATFRALTTPFETRVQQIVLSLERMRWLPARLDSPPIIVNVPQFKLFAFRTTEDNARDILQMDVIVGSAFKGRRTPVFAADMQYVVLQPYWDVPRSILLKELLPSIQADPGWVTKNGYEIVQGPGDDARVVPATAENVRLLAAGKLRLRQKPAPENALGRVKFIFPNRHSVYLHDTPAPALFARARRAFSHGCIRVAEPMALLAHVLRDQPAWDDARMAEALKSPKPVRIPLTRPIRVFILYGTALATEGGATLFFDDIYDQDALLTRLLHSRSAQFVNSR